jgi:hypothetical protein
MSEENVEIVKMVHPPSGTDLTELYADDAQVAALIDAAMPLFDPCFDFEAHGAGIQRVSGAGLRALSEAWREWLQPFESFRTEVEEFIDVDEERVLVLIRDHPRPRGTDAEFESLGCSLWTLRERKIVRVDFYPTRQQGLEAAGASE